MTQRLLIALLYVASVHAQTTLASSALSIAIGNERNITLGAPASAAVSIGQAMIMNRELAQVVQVNGRQLLVNRGQYGTTAATHARGTTTWFGPVNAFVQSDPSGACVRTALPYVPVVAISTGNAYDCIGSVYTLVAGVVSVLGTVNGGTGNNVFTAGECIQGGSGGTSLESAGAPCASSGGAAVLTVSADWTTATATGDGQFYFTVPSRLNGLDLTAIVGTVVSVGTTGTLTVQVARCSTVATGDTCSGTVADMLSTRLTIDSNEASSATAAIPAVIDATYMGVTTNMVLRVDIDAVQSTPAEGLILTLIFG